MSAQTNPPFVYDVFISYSSQDKGWVRGELLQRLDAAGLKTFIDFRDFDIGAPSLTEMERGVLTSHKTLLVLTPAYLKSQWTEFENLMLQTLDPANRARRLIPLRKELCELPLRIGMLTYVDFSDPSELDLAWQKLLRGLAAPNPTVAPPAAPPPPAAAVGPSPAALRRLREVLARLYANQQSARRVVDDAGLANAAIDWSGSANDYWHAIIQAALNSEQLAALLVIATEEYPGNRELAGALGELLR